jgi:diaminohydroxyphosphoribosylaminopyrimidine deaminase / 5-amino-6-(5-phosphoribosylamino)uracil reductase
MHQTALILLPPLPQKQQNCRKKWRLYFPVLAVKHAMFTTLDIQMMQRCFALARRGIRAVSPNPMVGAVLVHQNRIIGEGWHQAWGQAHAEVHCLASVKPADQPLVRHATLYCSLEPCSHFGKTPPCADLILNHHIPEVVVSNTDPNPIVAGKGLDKLQQAGVMVRSGLLQEEGAWLNRAFFTWITQKRPYIILKWAQSPDGFLGKPDKRTNITGAATQRMVHRWRSEVDAILVGAGTAVTDNPKLDVRHYFGRAPLRVLLDGNGRVPKESHLLADSEPALVFGRARTGLPPQKTMMATAGSVALTQVLEQLRQQNCATLLVEGGAQVLQQFLDAGLWDELRVLTGDRYLHTGVAAPRLPAEARLREQYRLAADQVCIYRRLTEPEPLTLLSTVGLPV